MKYTGDASVNDIRGVNQVFGDQVAEVKTAIEPADLSAPATPGTSVPGPPTTAPSAGIGSNSGTTPQLPSTGSMTATAQPLSPEGLAQSFNSGVQAGAPASAGAEALSQGISNTTQSNLPQHPTAPSPVASASTVPTSGGFAFEAPQHTSDPAFTPPADTQSTAYAAPVAPIAAAPPPMAPPAAAAGPLPAYGSDLRPVVPSPAAPPLPPAAAPVAAPVNAASGTSAAGQPGVVRPQPTTPATTAPTGVFENAMASATAGAVAGAASEHSVAQARLERLLEAVARQEPKLNWAIGDREDGPTVLVTDLASGWIPPHVEIPYGVSLLEPARRSGSIQHLLGDTTHSATWTPGHYLPPAKDVDPVTMSFRARQVPDIDELNWELTQATNWRDGLPRLAHTLAKAGIAGTGVLESEADLLREHLTTVRNQVVKTYPDHVDAAEVGNWQLLAAIAALIATDTTTLKYHFAWFQALSMATHGGTR